MKTSSFGTNDPETVRLISVVAEMERASNSVNDFRHSDLRIDDSFSV